MFVYNRPGQHELAGKSRESCRTADWSSPAATRRQGVGLRVFPGTSVRTWPAIPLPRRVGDHPNASNRAAPSVRTCPLRAFEPGRSRALGSVSHALRDEIEFSPQVVQLVAFLRGQDFFHERLIVPEEAFDQVEAGGQTTIVVRVKESSRKGGVGAARPTQRGPSPLRLSGRISNAAPDSRPLPPGVCRSRAEDETRSRGRPAASSSHSMSNCLLLLRCESGQGSGISSTPSACTANASAASAPAAGMFTEGKPARDLEVPSRSNTARSDSNPWFSMSFLF